MTVSSGGCSIERSAAVTSSSDLAPCRAARLSNQSMGSTPSRKSASSLPRCSCTAGISGSRSAGKPASPGSSLLTPAAPKSPSASEKAGSAAASSSGSDQLKLSPSSARTCTTVSSSGWTDRPCSQRIGSAATGATGSSCSSSTGTASASGSVEPTGQSSSSPLGASSNSSRLA